MPVDDFTQLLRRGISAAEEGTTLIALLQLESAARLGSSPLLLSYLGYCLARERRQYKQAVALCQQALQHEPGEAVHYLNLARVYLAAGQKVHAIKTLRLGLKHNNNRAIIAALQQLGIRKEPVFPTLSRNHPLNKYFGLLLLRLGIR